MLVDYAVPEMGLFDDYSDTVPCAKKIGGNGITTIILHVAKCITFNQTKSVTSTLIAKLSLKSLYSRLVFKVINNFAASPNFEKSRKRFHHKSRKPKAPKNEKIGLQCYITIPPRVTILHEN